jgi:hypothetical protein
MCVVLFEEQGIALHKENDFQVRLFDATNVKKPGLNMTQIADCGG